SPGPLRSDHALALITRLQGDTMSIVRSNFAPMLIWLAWGPLLALSTAQMSCRQLDPAFCASHPDDVDCARRSGIDAGMFDDNEQCAYPTPVCDIFRSMCVPCTSADLGSCAGTTPVCGDERCRGCVADSECASQTCLPDGACASPLDVLYVAPDGSD